MRGRGREIFGAAMSENVTNADFRLWLRAHAACGIGRRFVGKRQKTFVEAWELCDEASWLRWAIGHSGVLSDRQWSNRYYDLTVEQREDANTLRFRMGSEFRDAIAFRIRSEMRRARWMFKR